MQRRVITVAHAAEQHAARAIELGLGVALALQPRLPLGVPEQPHGHEEAEKLLDSEHCSNAAGTWHRPVMVRDTTPQGTCEAMLTVQHPHQH